MHVPGQVQLKLSLGSVLVGMDQAISAGLLVNELICNSLKHGFPDQRRGEVQVELQPANPDGPDNEIWWSLRVGDTGAGLPPDIESKRQTSLGLQLVDDLIAQLGGSLAILSQPGAGTEFVVLFKALEPAPLVMPV